MQQIQSNVSIVQVNKVYGEKGNRETGAEGNRKGGECLTGYKSTRYFRNNRLTDGRGKGTQGKTRETKGRRGKGKREEEGKGNGGKP